MNESGRHWELALDRPGSAGPATLRYSAAFAVAIVAATIAVVVFGYHPLTAFPQFATLHASFVFVVDGIVAFLLFGQFAYRRRPTYLLLGAAYLFNALVMIPFLLTFPGALRAEGVVIGGSQSSVWVWHAWHIVFPLLVILSLLVHERDAEHTVPPQQIVPGIAWTVVAAAALATLVAIATSVFHERLPVLVTPDRVPVTPTFHVAGGIAVAVTATALALAVWSGRRRAILHIWLAVAIAALLGDTVASLTAPGRYTVGWYFGRVESMVAATVLLLVYLTQTNRLYRQLSKRVSELFASNRKLAALVEEKEALVAELQQRKEEIRQLAHFDPVTELPNRRLLMDRLEHALAQGARHGHATALLFLDLDKFKAVNDRLGHEAGDRLLHEVGARIAHCVRREDTASRLGGDEFVVLLPVVAKKEDAEATAEKILKALGEPITLAGEPLEITASVGVALSGPGARLTASEFLARADEAMYVAKKSGRNRCCVAA